jgi:hypothetical protein
MTNIVALKAASAHRWQRAINALRTQRNRA